MFNRTVDSVTNWNAQLYREIKGKFNQRNIAISVILSLIVQGFIYFIYQNSLPTIFNTVNRYCIGNIPPEQHDYYPYENNFCLQNAGGVFNINWQLWHLDIFISLSIIAIFFLLIPGCYLLIADLTKEEDRGTLNFIRLSPQTAKSFFVGKILGVPSLIYLMVLLGLPWHFIEGIQAQIPLILIMGFYGVLIISCAFFYSGSLLYSLTFKELLGFKVWFGSGLLLLVMYLLCVIIMSSSSFVQNSLDWSVIFYPGTVLIYLVKSTNLPAATVRYLNAESLNQLNWFSLHLWRNPVTGISFIMANYLMGIYWLGIGLSRRFYNPDAQILTKKNSYFLTAILTIVMVGFALQFNRSNAENYFGCLILLLGLNFMVCLGLVIILTPQGQTLQDWCRYHHQTSFRKMSFWKQLILNDDAPSIVSIGINWLISAVISFPAIYLISERKYFIALILSLVFQLTLLILLATIAQILLMLKTKKRNVMNLSGLSLLVFSPVLIGLIFKLEPTNNSVIWLFSFLPMLGLVNLSISTLVFSIFSQVGAIALLNLHLSQKLRKLGESTTKALLAS